MTPRAIITGFVLGAVLVPCNVYSGLKIGWSFNMSIAAALLSYGFWNGLHAVGRAPRWGIYENNINQTAASSSASIISAGLVAPIPALTLLTGRELAYPILVVWVFVVSLLGVVVAVGIRRHMLQREKLPFPNGVATAETIREMYGHGREAVYRIKLLIGGGVISGGLKMINDFWYQIPSFVFPGRLTAPANLVSQGIPTISMRNLGFTVDPSLLLIGFGAIVGLRVGISLLLGAVLGWLLLPKELLARGWVLPGSGEVGAFWFSELLEWLLWPGVALMVTASLTSFLLSIIRMVRQRNMNAKTDDDSAAEKPDHVHYIPRSWFRIGLAVAFVASVVAQKAIFNIPIWLGVTAFGFTFVLAIVAGRVSGETGIPPIGALGKITQVTFGVLSPANVTTNLMAANVTGGAAGQCSDLLHDLKTGLLINAKLRYQVIAQLFGVLSGSLAGTAAYLVLIRDPASMLLTPEWPAPAVATWKAVAEVMAEGLSSLPAGTGFAVIIACVVGAVLAALERSVPEKAMKWIPSASSIGLALVIPPSISIAMFLGGLLAELVGWFAPDWRKKFVIVIAAGLVAGESLAGVARSVWSLFGGS